MAKLIFIGEKFKGRVYEFVVEKTTVGRGDHNTLTLHDSSVSHSHAEVLVYGTEVIVRDLGSSNGTYVNGVRLQAQQRPLLAGQVVEFGSVMALLEPESPSASDTTTDVTAMHSYVRHLHDPPEAPKKPAAMTLDAGTPATTTDHTLMLPQAPRAEATVSSPTPETARSPATSSNKTVTLMVAAAVVLGLAALLWLVFWRK